MSNMFVSNSSEKVFESDDSAMINYPRAAPTLVMPISALAIGENPPYLAFIVCSSQS